MKKDALGRVLGAIGTLVDATLSLVGGAPGELDFGGVKSKRGSELGKDMLGMSLKKCRFHFEPECVDTLCHRNE